MCAWCCSAVSCNAACVRNAGALRKILGMCISSGHLPGKKSARTVVHLCGKTRTQAGSAVSFAGGRYLDSVGINLGALLDNMESGMNPSEKDAKAALATYLQTTILEEGFSFIDKLLNTRPSTLLRNSLSAHDSSVQTRLETSKTVQ